MQCTQINKAIGLAVFGILFLIAAPTAQATDTVATQGLWGEEPLPPPEAFSNAEEGEQVLPTSFRFVQLSPVFFVHNQSVLTRKGQQALDAAVEYIQKSPDIHRIIVEGSTDEVGSQSFNYGLSDRRIRTVRSYLTALGVDSDLIEGEGKGENRPVDENWTRPGRARNRQVAIYAVHWNRGTVDPY